MKEFPIITRTHIITVLLALCAIGIFGATRTGYAEADAQNTQNMHIKQLVSPLLTHSKPPHASCGEVNARSGEVAVVLNGQTAARAEACFWRTYQHCQAKTLIFHQMGVDTGLNDILWLVKQKGQCRIVELVSHYSASMPQRNHSYFITCTKLQKTRRGLLLSKCDKNANLFVPAPTSAI